MSVLRQASQIRLFPPAEAAFAPLIGPEIQPAETRQGFKPVLQPSLEKLRRTAGDHPYGLQGLDHVLQRVPCPFPQIGLNQPVYAVLRGNIIRNIAVKQFAEQQRIHLLLFQAQPGRKLPGIQTPACALLHQ
ncbi:hypothetical protein D1872_249110 [compost metagenome]